MKKAKKIAIAIIGAVAAIGAVLIGKAILDKNEEVFYQTDYGIPYTIDKTDDVDHVE